MRILIIIEWKEAIHSPLFDCVYVCVCVRVYSLIPPPNTHAPYNVYRLPSSLPAVCWLCLLYISAVIVIINWFINVWPFLTTQIGSMAIPHNHRTFRHIHSINKEFVIYLFRRFLVLVTLKQSGRKRKRKKERTKMGDNKEARINNIPLAGKGNRIPTPAEWLMSAMQAMQPQQQLFSFLFWSNIYISRVFFPSAAFAVLHTVRVKLFLRLLTWDWCVICACHFVHCRSPAQLFEFPLLLKSTRLKS